MSGSSPNEHRQKRVPLYHWLLAVGLVAAAAAFGGNYAKGQEPSTEGVIPLYTYVCEATVLDEYTTEKYETFTVLMDKVRAGGVESLTPEENIMGALLTEEGCGAVAQTYNITVINSVVTPTGSYALIKFDDEYGFAPFLYVIRLDDFKPGAIL